MVPRAALPHPLDKPQHAVYRLRHHHSAARIHRITLGGEDTVRLQNMPATDQIHDVAGHALFHLYCKGPLRHVDRRRRNQQSFRATDDRVMTDTEHRR